MTHFLNERYCVRLGRLFPLAVLGVFLALHVASAGPIEEVLERMKDEDFTRYRAVAEQLKKAGNETFNQPSGFQARVLRSFCSEVYGEQPQGVRPAGKGAKSAPKALGLSARITAMTRDCRDAAFVRNLLLQYWMVTAEQLEGLLGRLAKLVNVRSGGEESLLYGDPHTAVTEAALEAHANEKEFWEAVQKDLDGIKEFVFGDLGVVFQRVLVKVRIIEKFQSTFSNGKTVEENVKKFFEQDLKELENSAKNFPYPK